jgi:hypothetical protein
LEAIQSGGIAGFVATDEVTVRLEESVADGGEPRAMFGSVLSHARVVHGAHTTAADGDAALGLDLFGHNGL